MTKRCVDFIISCLSLLILFPVLLIVAFVIKIDSSGPVFFRQVRMGRGFWPFTIYKFRTMLDEPRQSDRTLAVPLDPRITCVGRFLRKTKMDELPQLINVLKGEMSLVGPRPEVQQYVELFRADYEEILRVRPGMTDLASLKYRDEAAVLGRAQNPEEEYIKRILPEKIGLAKEYLRRSSLAFDLSLIFKTIRHLIDWRVPS